MFLKSSDFFFSGLSSRRKSSCYFYFFVIGCSHLPHSSEIKADEFSALSVFLNHR